MDTLTGAELLSAGKAFVDVSHWRSVAVSKSEALGWLNDLVTADLADIPSGVARHSLLLSPTGSVLAGFTVTVVDGTVVLFQDPRQPRSIAALLEPYVLSSDVELEDRTGRYSLFAFPGLSVSPDAAAAWSAPSCLGAGGDLIAPGVDHERLASVLSDPYVRVMDEDAEAWRIASGIPRIGVDTLDGDLPQEARLDHVVSFDKGCFLGQEAVAKVRNLGHPRRWLAALESDAAVSAGDAVSAGGVESGFVTSVASVNGASLALARIRWEHRDTVLRTAAGAELRPRVPA